jgi:hypothetical protein
VGRSEKRGGEEQRNPPDASHSSESVRESIDEAATMLVQGKEHEPFRLAQGPEALEVHEDEDEEG